MNNQSCRKINPIELADACRFTADSPRAAIMGNFDFTALPPAMGAGMPNAAMGAAPHNDQA